MISKDKIERIAKSVIEDHENKFEEVKERWLSLVGRYENKLRADSISSKTKSKLTLGGAYALVENSIPRLLARKPKYKYLGREGKDGKASEMYDEFSNYQWDEADVSKKLKQVVRWGLVCGLAGWKIGWKKEEVIKSKRGKEILGIKITNPTILEMADKLKVGKSIKVEEADVTQNYTFTPIKPFDIIWNTDAENIEDVTVIGNRTEKTVKELKALGFDTKNVVSSIKNATTIDEWKQKIESQDGLSNYSINKYIDNESVMVYEMYVKEYNDEGVLECYQIFLASQGNKTGLQTIHFGKNPFDEQFMPIGIFRPVDRLGKFYGFGVIEPVTGTLDAEEDSLNIAMDVMRMDVARPMEYNPMNLLIPNSIKYEAGTLVPVRKLGESVRVMETPMVNMNSLQYMQDYMQRAKQNISGITDFQTGSDQLKGAKTLGEIQIKTQESNARIGMILEQLEDQVLLPLGKYALYLNKQYLQDSKMFYRILGRKGDVLEKELKLKDIEAVKDVFVVSGSTSLASQQAEIQKWTLLLNQIYMEEKSANPTPINKEPVWERLLENGFMLQDLELFLPNATEREEEEVAGLQAQAKDSKEENARPETARVLPTDNPEVHIKYHQAEVRARMDEIKAMEQQGMAETPEYQEAVQQMQILIQHLNDHSMQAGGQVPQYSQGMEVGQGINEATNTGIPQE